MIPNKSENIKIPYKATPSINNDLKLYYQLKYVGEEGCKIKIMSYMILTTLSVFKLKINSIKRQQKIF
jgi:hypothetical protein